MIGRTGMFVACTRPPGSPRRLPLPSPDLLALTLATSNVASLSCAGRTMATPNASSDVSASFRMGSSYAHRAAAASALRALATLPALPALLDAKREQHVARPSLERAVAGVHE